MELADFKQSIEECSTLLRAVQALVPKRVDQGLLNYFQRLQDDPVGLELLRNAMVATGPAK